MSEMIERVASAIENAMQCRRCGALIRAERPSDACCDRPDWYDAPPALRARAAIEAMREPSAAMIQSRIDCYPRELRIRGGDVDVWRTMIDAALAEGTEAPQVVR